MSLHLHLREHFLYYISFIGVQVCGWILFGLVAPDKILQMMVAVMISLFSTTYALIHHKVSHTLTSKIVIEYLLMAALGMVLTLVYLK